MKIKKKTFSKGIPVHYTAECLINPAHPVTINVIGCGGTGSQVLNSLARMHAALKALGHPGLYIRAIGPKKVTEANMGRQLFAPADIDSFKVVTLVGRINRFFGTDWEGIPDTFGNGLIVSSANITISCVDSGKSRKTIKETLNANVQAKKGCWRNPYEKPFYWLDFGNMLDRGQAVLGTLQMIDQPTKSDFSCRGDLPTVDLLHPDILVDSKDDDQGPSCSLAEALQKQDLFINTNLANEGLAVLWKMFRHLHIMQHGLYLNLETGQMNPIPIK